MLSDKDKKALKKIAENWSRFVIARKKGAFDHECSGPNWLTMLKRESMLNEVLRILNKYQKLESNYNF